MAYDAYLFEKASYVPDSLSRLAEDLKLLEPSSPAHREVAAYLNVALRHSLQICASLTGARFDASWVVGIARDGHSHWAQVVEPALKAAAASAEDPPVLPLASTDDREDDEGWDDDDGWEDEDDSDEAEAWRGEDSVPDVPHGRSRRRRFLDDDTVLSAARTLSALADLVEAIRKHGCQDHPDARFAPRLGAAFNGATKVVAEALGAEWSHDWVSALADHGREALSTIVCAFRDHGLLEDVGDEIFEPLNEAWLSELDPERTPEAEQEAERARRAKVTRKTAILHDLVPPDRHRNASLSQLLVKDVPGHDTCAAYAQKPEGVLILHGELHSALHPIQWAIGRYWFVERLFSVGAVDWNELVGDNIMAQSPGLWSSPYLLITSLCPVPLWTGGGYADPGYAERLLEHRLLARIPTVITIERYGWELLNLRSRTIELLKGATNVVLSRLSEAEQKRSGLGT